MNYSNADAYSPYPIQEGDPSLPQQRIQLTPEEIRILKQCSQEGIVSRAIPLGIAFGVCALVGARAGPLNHARWGAKPAVIGLGLIGYFLGRFSYSKICFQRALAVPDGNLRKMFPQLVDPSIQQVIDSNENYFATVETPKLQDDLQRPQSYSTDIDIASTSNFDTIPSGDYYNSASNPLGEAPKTYISYDDLRKQNRQEYASKLYPNEPNRSAPRQAYPGPVREPPVARRPDPLETQPFEGTQRTKYGDAWG